MHLLKIAAVIVVMVAGALAVPPVRAFVGENATKTMDDAQGNIEIAQFNVAAVGNDKVAEDIAKAYGVPVSQITQLHASGWGYGEIEMMYALAKDSGKSVADIKAMRDSDLGWGEIAKRLHLSLGHIPHLGRIVSGNKGH